MARPTILLTNDDGIHSPWLAALAESMEKLGEVFVYAPDRNQSGVGHGVSLHRPLRVQEIRPGWHSVDGTPTDCVMLAVRDLMRHRPVIVLSGINDGPNMGDDVTYSGTVAGAYEGMLLGLPSMAVSCVSHAPQHIATAAHYARQLAEFVLVNGVPEDTVLNVNVPDVPLEDIQGIQFTRMGRRSYEDEIVHRTDPRGVAYYWIGGDTPGHVAAEGTDFDAVDRNYVSVTPLHRDLTNYESLEALRGALHQSAGR